MITSKTQQLIDQYKAPIAEQLRGLKQALEKLTGELRQSVGLPGQVPIGPIIVFEPVSTEETANTRIEGFKTLSTSASRSVASDVMQQLEYQLDDRVNRSPRCYGVIGVPRRLLNDAKAINRRKDELKATIAPIANRRIRIEGKDANGKRTVLVRQLSTVLLRQIQFSSINLLAAYRELPIIDEPVDEFQFMLTRTRSVPRSTVRALRDQLNKHSDPVALSDLERLSALPANEYLVSPKAYYERMRAHVFFQRLDGDVRARRIISAELPILFPITARSPRPTVIAPKAPQSGRKHPPGRIEAEPIVQSLNYFRMKAPYRTLSQ